jgi:Na+-driven multidrug efflux pump
MLGLVGTKVLQTRSIMMPSAIIGVVTFLANIFFNWWFINMFGFVGSPIATTVRTQPLIFDRWQPPSPVTPPATT